MASDLTNTLIGCQDPNPQVRTAAEAALASAEQSNLAEFFLALGKEVSYYYLLAWYYLPSLYHIIHLLIYYF